MKEQQNSYSIRNFSTYIVFAIIFGTYLLGMKCLFSVRLLYILKFLILNIVSIFLPGFAFLSLLKIKANNTEKMFLSYGLGYGLVMLEYFISEIFNRHISFLAVTIIFAIASVAVLFMQVKKGNLEALKPDGFREISGASFEKGVEIIELVAFVAVLILITLSYAGNYAGVDVIDVFASNRDLTYWCNNTAALKVQFPAENLFFDGLALNYHYFSSIPIAFFSEAYGIDIFTLSFPLYVFTKAILLVGAVEFLLTRFEISTKTLAAGNVLIILTTGLEKVCNCGFVTRIMVSSFGFEIGLSYELFFFAFIVLLWREEKFDIKLLIATLVVWAACVGSKSPFASIAIFIAAFSSLYGLIKRHWAKAFGYGLSILAVFLIICKYCVGMFSVVSGDSAWEIKQYTATDIMNIADAEKWDSFAQFFIDLGKNNIVWAVIVRIVMLNPAVVLTTLVAIIYFVYAIIKKKVDFGKIYFVSALIITAIVGITLGIVLNAGGQSESYFSVSAVAVMYLIILEVLSIDFSFQKIGKSILIPLCCLFLVLTGLGVYRYLFSANEKDGLVTYLQRGYEQLSTREADEDMSMDASISKNDVYALAWLRDNAEKDALVMSDRSVITNDTDYMMYGLFSERQEYMEGIDMLDGITDELNEEFYNRRELIWAVFYTEDGAIQQAIDEGVDYFVQTKEISPLFVPDEDLLELVASSDTINIYKVKK